MKALRAGIIGLGVGEQHLIACRKHAHCEVKTICDFNPAKLDEVSSRHPGIVTVDHADAILEDEEINVVCVASHDNHHAAQIIKALEAGMHVFAEKPLCLSVEEAERIAITLRSRTGPRLSTNVILRCSRRFVDLRDRILAGEMGEVYAIEAEYDYGRIHKLTEGWRGEIDFYSVTLGGGIHLVDLIRWLTGAEVERVSAMGNRIATAKTKFRHKDFVCGLLQLDNGVCAKVSVNFGCVHPHFHGLRVYGTEATFVNDSPDAWLIRSRDKADAPTPISTEYPGCAKGDLLSKFLDDLTVEQGKAVDAAEVFRTLAPCFAMEQALQTGESVEVAPILKRML